MVRFLAERFFVSPDDCPVAEAPGTRLLATLYVPDDEVCLYFFESESAELVARAAAFDRVVAVVPVGEPVA